MTAQDTADQSSYFSDPTLTPEDLAAFFASTRELCALQPWTWVDDECVLKVDLPDYGVTDACLSVFGSADDVRGFAVHASLADRNRCLENSVSAPSDDGLWLSFKPRTELPEPLRAEVGQHAWPIAHDVFPVLQRFDRGKAASVQRKHVLVAGAIARTLAASMHKDHGPFEDIGSVSIEGSYEDAATPETILTIPHPDLEIDHEPPPPRARTLDGDNPYDLPLPEPKLHKLEAILGEFTLHRAVGIFCAAASLPKFISPHLWLHDIGAAVDFPDQAAAEEAVSLLLPAYNAVVERLQREEIDGLVPQVEDVAACHAWARGYASMFRHTDIPRPTEDLVDALFAMEVLAEDPETLELLDQQRGAVPREEVFAKVREALADEAAFLWEAWAADRRGPPQVPPQRSEPKVGRNDPCPCGSGKKYKKCCATSAG